jgi:hypothetical protein
VAGRGGKPRTFFTDSVLELYWILFYSSGLFSESASNWFTTTEWQRRWKTDEFTVRDWGKPRKTWARRGVKNTSLKFHSCAKLLAVIAEKKTLGKGWRICRTNGAVRGINASRMGRGFISIHTSQSSDRTPHNLVESRKYLEKIMPLAWGFSLKHGNGGINSLSKLGSLLPNYTVTYHTRTQMWISTHV